MPHLYLAGASDVAIRRYDLACAVQRLVLAMREVYRDTPGVTFPDHQSRVAGRMLINAVRYLDAQRAATVYTEVSNAA